MSEDLWCAVDGYIGNTLVKTDAALDAALEASAAAGLPSINVSASHGKLLQILARLVNARAILEIGTLGGYSTIWMARALPPGGRLISLECDPKHAELARANIQRAGLERVVDIRLGVALETLPVIAAEKTGPFDLIFIDADKVSTPQYFTWAVKLARAGSLIVVDNVVRKGEVANARTNDPAVRGMRQFIELAAAEPRIMATALQTVGCKGYDGLSIALVTS
jgi:predicted O-methyltransferase YrrM